ncbi:AP-3 complex subunit beta [Rhodotorula toruloides]
MLPSVLTSQKPKSPSLPFGTVIETHKYSRRAFAAPPIRFSLSHTSSSLHPTSSHTPSPTAAAAVEEAFGFQPKVGKSIFGAQELSVGSMSDKALQNLRTNFERLGARLGENLAEHSRDLGLVDAFASGSGGGSGKYLENGAVLTAAGIDETKRMLASKREVERTEGLKRVIAMMTKNLPVTSFFPLVTSLLAPTTSLQARSLISLYIVHCASHAPELALLSINAYQKDLSDPNPLVRAGAITTLASMQLPDIRELVGIAIQKGARDTSWYVRRAAADAVRNLYLADPTKDNRSSLLLTLKVLLDNASPLTIGAALTAWETLCPSAWNMIHQNYRRFCKMLMDVEEWGQTVLLRVLVRYGRTFFLDPATTKTLDPDAESALKSSEALLQHLNPAVVSGVVKLHYYLGPPARHSKIVRPLLRLLKGPPEVAAVALEDCALIAEERPDLFAEHISSFFVRFSDPVESRRNRLRVIVALANQSNIQVVLRELLTYVNDIDDVFSAEAVKAVGTCAQQVPQVAPECLKTLTDLLTSKHDPIVSTAVLVHATLICSPTFPSTASRSSIITRLGSYLYTGKIKDASARATVFGLVGQFAADGLVEGCGPDVIRFGAQNFAEEAVPAKLQLLTCSAKLFVLSHLSRLTPHLSRLSLLFNYLALLARYDLAYEVRDRARFLAGLVASGGIGKGKGREGEEGEGAKLMLGEEEFKQGLQVEDLIGASGENEQEEEKQNLTAEQVRKVLFEGKTFDGIPHRSFPPEAQLGTFALSLLGIRLFAGESPPLSHIPPYPSTVPPSSIRDPPASSSSSPPRSTTPLQGFGSNSIRSSSGTSHGASKVVLTPGSGSRSATPTGLSPAAAAARKKQSLNEFFADSETSSEEEDEVEEEEDEEDDEEDEEEESGEEESEDGSD